MPVDTKIRFSLPERTGGFFEGELIIPVDATYDSPSPQLRGDLRHLGCRVNPNEIIEIPNVGKIGVTDFWREWKSGEWLARVVSVGEIDLDGLHKRVFG